MPIKKTKKAAAEKSPKAAKTARKSPKTSLALAADPTVRIDYPSDGEAVQAGHYAIRVSAPEASQVDVSIDGAAWLPCREAVGFFWYDWEPSAPGAYCIEARAKIGGAYKRSLPRECSVVSLSPAFG